MNGIAPFILHLMMNLMKYLIPSSPVAPAIPAGAHDMTIRSMHPDEAVMLAKTPYSPACALEDYTDLLVLSDDAALA